MTQRTLIIGDVHGCINELKSLVSKLNYDPKTDDMIFVGDLINRGPDSLGVWRYYQELGARSVLGNHELHLIRDDQGIEVHKKWISHFKHQFGDAYPEYLADIKSWPLYIETEDYLVVHGGLLPGEHPRNSDPLQLTSIRTYSPETGLQQSETSQPWFDYYDEKKLVVFGHWAKLCGVKRPNVIGLDTGCVYGKKLTALILPQVELVSVKAEKIYSQIKHQAK